MTERFEEIEFNKFSVDDGHPVQPKCKEEVLDTIFHETIVLGKTDAIVEKIGVVSAHKFAEGIRAAIAKFIPNKEILVQ